MMWLGRPALRHADTLVTVLGTPSTPAFGTETGFDDDISVVIPNLNGGRWLTGCLSSLAASEHAAAEVIVADDSSTDDSSEIASRLGARFLTGGSKPSGFARTANRGIRSATSTWVFLLNNDTEVSATTLSRMIEVARSSRAGIVAPLVLSMRDPTVIDSAGLLVFPDGTGRPRLHGSPLRDAPAAPEQILLPIGTAMLVHRDVFGRVGLLDESFESYVEDLEWGLRAARAGVRTMLAPNAVLFHWFSGTTGTLSPYKARCVERNHVVTAIRHLPLRDVVLLPVWTTARWVALARVAVAGDAESDGGTIQLALAALRGTLSGVIAIPSAIRDRRRLETDFPVDGRLWRRQLVDARCTVDAFRRFGA